MTNIRTFANLNLLNHHRDAEVICTRTLTTAYSISAILCKA